MKKIFQKYLTFLSATMLLPFNMSVLAKPIGDSHNVKYGDIIPMQDDRSGKTDIQTGILEYIVTFPKKTDVVPYGQKLRKLGAVSVRGKAFIKPYKVAVNISRQNFKLVTKRRTKNKSNKIVFDVVRVSKDKSGDLKNDGSLLGKTLYYYRNSRAKNASQRNAYMEGRVANIAQSVDVGVAVKNSQWKRACPGRYKGKITYVAKLDSKNIF